MTRTERDELRALANDLDAALAFDRPLADLTTWRIGGPADALLQPRSVAALVSALQLCRRRGWPVRVMGNGSNLLVPDEGVAGVVVHLANQMAGWSFEGAVLRAEAGCFLPKLAREAADRGLAGLDCVVGVPGTVGGGCVTNAGIPSGTLGDVLREVEVVDGAGATRTLARSELALGHRDSRLRHEPLIALAATFDLPAGDPEAIRRRMAEHLDYRRRTQPLSQPSCGSVFRRPVEGFPGALIEAAGCKSLTRGQAQVSELHANWIVNLGGARAEDVRWLIETVAARVLANSGVALQLEVEIWSSGR